jgi:hypothetical protein
MITWGLPRQVQKVVIWKGSLTSGAELLPLPPGSLNFVPNAFQLVELGLPRVEIN